MTSTTKEKTKFTGVQQNLLLPFLLWAVIQAVAADENDPAAEAIATLCDEDYYLETLETQLLNIGSTLQAHIDAADAAATKFRLAEAANDNQEMRCLLRGLTAAATATFTANKQAKAKIESDAAAAIEGIRQQRTLIATALKLSTVKVAVDSGSVHTAQNSPAHSATLQMAITTDEPAQCTREQGQNTGLLQGKTPNPAKLHKIKLTTEANLAKAIRTAKLKLTADNSCANNNGGRTVSQALASCAFHNSAATAAYLPTEATKAGPLQTETHIYANDKPKGDCHSDVAKATKTSDRRLYLGKLLCEALSLTPQPVMMTELSGPALAADTAVVAAVAACNPEFSELKDASDSKTNKALLQYLQRAYSKDNAEFQTKFATFIDKKTVKVKENGQIKTKTIGDVTESETEQQILNSLVKITAVNGQREVSSEKKTENEGKQGENKDGDNKAAADGKIVCSTIQNQTECEGVKGTAPPARNLFVNRLKAGVRIPVF
uniref:Variant surface glycoprotein 744 n=1 Tax=Trypanosoma brucei TaxID=5691 RepID=M4SZ09_9TRYP|nr:variant surface glycoprotein 744 [Trypanosoma brucei]